MMDGQGKSDRPIVPTKPANKPGKPGAESVEGRGLAKGNPSQGDTLRTQGRERVQQALARVRQAAERDKGVKFTALLHHVYAVDTLREAYFRLKRDAAAGIDGQTWEAYGEGLEERLQDLSGRLQRGAYRARPVRRVYIPKRDGRQRPLGIPVVEDKIVQRATVAVLEAIYETDFLGFSYGFRPGRNQHQALEALDRGLMTTKVNWVLDADLRGFFDAIDHAWLVQFVQHRIGDRRMVRLLQKWLQAGVLEDGAWTRSEEGTPQGGSISPLLANIYLHYVFDQWAERWGRRQARGEVMVVRWADDFIVGFEHRTDAEAFLGALRERLGRYGLELHPEKTRLIEFGRYAAERRRKRGLPKPETPGFLGFTHVCGRGRNGRFTVVRRTVRERMRAKLREVKAELRRRLHEPIAKVGAWLGSVVTGHARYYGVAGNLRALVRFRWAVVRQWRRALARRSQTAHVSWARMERLIQHWLPPVKIHHPHASWGPGV
jgi:group II intron reverse transcriptase/maturase